MTLEDEGIILMLFLNGNREGGDQVGSKNRVPYLKVKAFLVERELSYKSVSDVINVTPGTVSKKLNGFGGDFTLKEVKLLNQRLGIPVVYFFELDVPKKER